MAEQTAWTPWPDLADMMTIARAKGLWFWCAYQNLWFSPDELQACWNDGRFQWGAVNWKLRHPDEYLAELQHQRESSNANVRNAIERIEKFNRGGR